MKFKTLLATALLTLPVLMLTATQAADSAERGTRVEPTSLTVCCYVYFNGKWMCIPC